MFDLSRLDEEGRRSVKQRGWLGHYIAGTYRVLARPIATHQIIVRAKILAFFWGMEDVAHLVEHMPERYLNPVLRAFGATIGKETVMGNSLRLLAANRDAFRPLVVGKQAFTARRVLIDLADQVVLGDNCTLASDVCLMTHIDVGHSPLKDNLYPVITGPVRIGRGAFIGSGAIITSGVTIGQCAVVGANSLVTNAVPPYCFAAGSPAKIIHDLDRSKIPPFDDAQAFIIPEGTL